MMFNLSIFDCLTEEERKLYNKYKANNKTGERQAIKEEILKSVKDYSEIREINKKALFDKNGKAIISKLIAGFENECVRLSESLVYNEENPKDIPLITDIIILDCPGSLDKDEKSWHEIILEQIINGDILIDGERYIVYSSSANQMKKRQVCLMQTDF